MNELQSIIRACEELGADGPAAVLATVVRVKGSAYRRPGARMLLLPEGRTIGTVSGGCLEGDVKLQAWCVLAEGSPTVVRYDSAADGEIVWQLGMGCKGIVDVLLERVSARPDHGVMGFLRRLKNLQRTGVVVRVLASEGNTGVEVGAFWAMDDRGNCGHDFRDRGLIALVERDAAAMLGNGQSRDATYELPGGHADVFLELVRPPLPLLICGAGHDAMPLARMAKDLGWHVTVCDHRPSYATGGRFPTADRVIARDPEEMLRPPEPGTAGVPGVPGVPGVAWCAAVIMSHQYHTDLAYLRTLLSHPLEYLGILGPRNRTQSLLGDLVREGIVPGARDLERLFAPVGLDIGAETPEGIALAVLAEVQAAMSRRTGGSLRDRSRPIHVMDAATARAPAASIAGVLP